MKIIKELIPYVVIILLVILIRTFIVTPVTVSGDSMDPTLKDKEVLILNKFDKSYKRFDVVVIKYGKERIIKRVIGLPNETIEYKDNVLYINGEIVSSNIKFRDTEDFKATTGSNEYFVLGDNRPLSKDSRMIGNFKKEDFVGKVKFRIWPFDKFGTIDK